MRKKTVMSRLLSRELSSLLFTVFLQTVVLDKPLKAASDVVGDACGPAVAAGLLLVLGLVVYSVVYYVVVPPLLGYLVWGPDLEMYLKAKVRRRRSQIHHGRIFLICAYSSPPSWVLLW